jgi:hypothetical protein
MRRGERNGPYDVVARVGHIKRPARNRKTPGIIKARGGGGTVNPASRGTMHAGKGADGPLPGIYYPANNIIACVGYIESAVIVQGNARGLVET